VNQRILLFLFLIFATLAYINLNSDSSKEISFSKNSKSYENNFKTELFNEINDNTEINEKSLLNKLYESKHSLENIYSDLDLLILNQKISSSNCHRISHLVGESFYLKNPNFDEVFGYDIYKYIKDNNCATGYFHGVIIGASKRMEDKKLILKLKVLANKYENLIKTEDNNLSLRLKNIEVLHGIGHALYVKYNDVEESLAICKKISLNPNVQNICASGVYMESSYKMSTLGLEVSPNDCLKNASEFRFSCYIGQRYPQDLVRKKTFILDGFKSCFDRNNNTNEKYICFRSLFYQIFLINNSRDIDFLTSVCKNEESYNLICLNTLKITMLDFNNQEGRYHYAKSICKNTSIFDFITCFKHLSQKNKAIIFYEYPKKGEFVF
jgi:predicted DNA-binding ribbon-helix-helix protein